MDIGSVVVEQLGQNCRGGCSVAPIREVEGQIVAFQSWHAGAGRGFGRRPLNSQELELIRTLILILCATATLALIISTIGAALAIITGHARWIELAWLSIAASLLATVVSELWPRDQNPEH
jgi:hypothetical protein